jgi:hypothetical protein
MVVADGTVLVVETEPNVVPILASTDNPRLPAGGVDLVIVLDTYHHIDDRIAYFRALHRARRKDGHSRSSTGTSASCRSDRRRITNWRASRSWRRCGRLAGRWRRSSPFCRISTCSSSDGGRTGLRRCRRDRSHTLIDGTNELIVASGHGQLARAMH